ncbi:MAG: nucleotidyltransferase family protein [Dysgonamonadaceae bacterium]|jgi:hypothetical protein|nr:nucleotidyltransferase family protein [Dysgonamonadaceae bacterium]
MLYTSFLQAKAHISEKDILLLRLLFCNSATQDNIDKLLEGYDMDSASLAFNTLLAYLMQEHSDIKFPDELIPRLKGVIRFLQYKNAALLEGFSDAGKRLNAKNIPLLLIKGIAMRFLDISKPRLMWDVDFVVDEENYDEAIRCAEEAGFTIKWRWPHSSDLIKGVAALDIHRLYMHQHGTVAFTSNNIRRIFIEARKETFCGVEVLIPRSEDLMLIALTNLYHNLVVDRNEKVNRYYCCYDILKIITSNQLNWDVIIDASLQMNVLYQIRIILEFVDELWPSAVPGELLDRIRAYPFDEFQVKRDRLTGSLEGVVCAWHNWDFRKCRTPKDIVSGLTLGFKYLCAKIIEENAIAKRYLFNLRYSLLEKKEGKI